MKRAALLILAIPLSACGLLQPSVVVVTATAPAETEPPQATATPLPTNTPKPSDTPRPTRTPEPTWEPAAMADIEAALREAGYRRFPIVDADGVKGFSWVNNNSYERVMTWENETIELQVLHDKSRQVRSEHMERHFAALDAVIPSGFMARLRDEHAAYNGSVSSAVSGKPDQMFAYHDEWRTVWAEYNASVADIGGYQVKFSLWWWQSTCPSKYLYCYYYGFPGLEFTGDSSFIFHSIFIWIPGGDALPSLDA